MIEYSPTEWQLRLLCRCRGSVFPKSLLWAVPSTLLAWFFFAAMPKIEGVDLNTWSNFNYVMGFLLVFRTQLAYTRFWEAATIVQRVRGTWFNAVSSCFAFCSHHSKDQDAVLKFKHTLVRLVSLLHCASLQQIAVMSDEAFEIIDLADFDKQSLVYLAEAPEKTLVILQWIQQLIVQNHRSGVLDVAPPIVTRVFQDLSNGIVDLVDCQKISEVMFPFPYAQLLTAMIAAYTLIFPLTVAVVTTSLPFFLMLNFISVFAFWSLNYIATEIEMPFGEDANDLPISAMQTRLNQALVALLDDHFSNCPSFSMSSDTPDCNMGPCPSYLIETHTETYACRRSMKILSQTSTLGKTKSPDSAPSLKPNSEAEINAVDAEDVKVSDAQVSRKAETGSPLAPMELPASSGIDVLPDCPAIGTDSLISASEEKPAATSNSAALKQLLQHASMQIEASLVALTEDIRTHFETASVDVDFVALHAAALASSSDDLFVKDHLLLKLSSVLQTNLAIMVRELDRIASECIPGKPAFPPTPQLAI